MWDWKAAGKPKEGKPCSEEVFTRPDGRTLHTCRSTKGDFARAADVVLCHSWFDGHAKDGRIAIASFFVVHVCLLTIGHGFRAHLRPMLSGFGKIDLTAQQEALLAANEPRRLHREPRDPGVTARSRKPVARPASRRYRAGARHP